MKLLNKKLKEKRKQIQLALGLLLFFGFANLLLDLSLYFMRDNYIFKSSSFLGIVIDFIFIVVGSGFAIKNIKEIYDFYLSIRHKTLDPRDRKNRIIIIKETIQLLKVYFIFEPLVFFYAVRINFLSINSDLLVTFNILFLVFSAIIAFLFLCALTFYIVSKVAIKTYVKKIKQQQLIGELGLRELEYEYLFIDDVLIETRFIYFVFEKIYRNITNKYSRIAENKFKINLKKRIIQDTIENSPPRICF